LIRFKIIATKESKLYKTVLLNSKQKYSLVSNLEANIHLKYLFSRNISKSRNTLTAQIEAGALAIAGMPATPATVWIPATVWKTRSQENKKRQQ
jgi:hypothetical protein